MSLYNMVNGFNPACILLMPMLGRKQDEYPRFRDCFLSDDNKHIVIYTRVGGGNRNCGYNEEALYKDPNFVRTWDDDFDSTYGYYEFRVPKEWEPDFEKIVSGDIESVSEEYKNLVRCFFPLLEKEGILDKIFRKENNVVVEATEKN